MGRMLSPNGMMDLNIGRQPPRLDPSTMEEKKTLRATSGLQRKRHQFVSPQAVARAASSAEPSSTTEATASSSSVSAADPRSSAVSTPCTSSEAATSASSEAATGTSSVSAAYTTSVATAYAAAVPATYAAAVPTAASKTTTGAASVAPTYTASIPTTGAASVASAETGEPSIAATNARPDAVTPTIPWMAAMFVPPFLVLQGLVFEEPPCSGGAEKGHKKEKEEGFAAHLYCCTMRDQGSLWTTKGSTRGFI
ncbi:unnamed protein product [Spirodela intermedia]|uniref:Uncharacterized protein n=1 Tax=Spirodela intermedia TaxID=51605 RepID=A0A7I8LGH2_SPIIN|nr:unnamed protein product [Spirodela intermedia]